MGDPGQYLKDLSAAYGISVNDLKLVEGPGLANEAKQVQIGTILYPIPVAPSQEELHRNAAIDKLVALGLSRVEIKALFTRR